MTTVESQEPFDPQWDLERAVEELSQRHSPGSLISGKTRNQLLHAWALVAGRGRVEKDLKRAIETYGSRSAAARGFSMSVATFRRFEEFVANLPLRAQLPLELDQVRAAFDALSPDGKTSFASVASQLLLEPEVLRHLRDPRIAPRLAGAVRDALRAADLRVAVEELDAALAAGEVLESTYQDWCERHVWVFGNTYMMSSKVRRLDKHNIVDVLLSDLGGFPHVVELKRTDMAVLRTDRSHRSHFFSSDVSRAIGQVHKYLDRLHDAVRSAVDDHPQLVEYHPQATIVIGRSEDWPPATHRALHGLNARLNGIRVMTFDHLSAQATQLLRVLDEQQS